MDSIPILLHLLPASKFEDHLNSQISEKQRPDASLYDAAAFNWYEISEGKENFQLRARQTDYLKDSTASETKQVDTAVEFSASACCEI